MLVFFYGRFFHSIYLACLLSGKIHINDCYQVNQYKNMSKDRNKNSGCNFKAILLLIGFFLFAVLGLQLGKVFNHASNSSVADLSPSLLPTVYRPATNQKNVLLFLSDDLSKQTPTILSIWLIVYSNDPPNMVFLSIYPESNDGNSKRDRVVEKHLRKEKGLFPSQQLWNKLISENYWWDDYLVFDMPFLGKFIDVAGGIDFDNRHLGGMEALSIIAAISDKSSLSKDEQIIIAKGICKRLHNGITPQQSNEDSIFRLASEHYLSDHTPDSLSSAWQSIVTVQPPVDCEFPTSP